MSIALEYTESILTLMLRVQNEKQRNYDLVHQCDLKTCDLLHELELHDIKGLYHAYLLMKELKQVRITRRKAKDELETLRFVEKYSENQVKQCENIIIDIVDKEKQLKCRHYNVRCDCR